MDEPTTKPIWPMGSEEVRHPFAELTYPYPLRGDFMAYLILPSDFTKAEAEKLGKFLLALPVEEE